MTSAVQHAAAEGTGTFLCSTSTWQPQLRFHPFQSIAADTLYFKVKPSSNVQNSIDTWNSATMSAWLNSVSRMLGLTTALPSPAQMPPQFLSFTATYRSRAVRLGNDPGLSTSR